MSAKVTIQVIISEHAFDRAKERLGMDRKAFETLALKAFVSGMKHGECKGRLNKYITKLFMQNGTANNTRIYGEIIYLFSGNTLITVYQLPNDLKKYLSLKTK